MRSSFVTLARALLLGIAVVHPAASATDPDLALKLLNHRHASAAAAPDAMFLRELVDADFRLTSAGGAWMGRDEYLARAGAAHALAGVSYSDVAIRRIGSVAVVIGLFEGVDADDRAVRLRYTDVYRHDGSRWTLVSAQNTPLRDGVTSAITRGVAPAAPSWRGTDPEGDDLAVLRRLNENYVRAFRDADVAWYDAHLAPDYVVVNPDGSLHDRAEALVQFAKPVFAERIRDFPVDEVTIRRFGDIALIHAQNAFELKDGRRGINRYTDIWQRIDGRWRCIAAHITPFAAPQ